MMRFERGAGLVAAIFTLILSGTSSAAPAAPPAPDADAAKAESHKFEPFKPEAVSSNGSVTVDGHAIAYQAIAGTLVVHPKGWDDVPRDSSHEKGSGTDDSEAGNPTAEASMFYVAYFKTAPHRDLD
jgi:hypothetical protein